MIVKIRYGSYKTREYVARYNVDTHKWEALVNGNVIMSARELFELERLMYNIGYTTCSVDTSSDPDLAAAIIRNGCN
jgi:hypothetical protein